MLTTEIKISRADYQTHLRYIEIVGRLSENLRLQLNSSPTISAHNKTKLDKKIQLAKSTKKSIDQECEIVNLDKNYSLASVFWLPIKVYYLIFHLLCITECIIKDDITPITSKHWTIVNSFTKMLEKGELEFSDPILNGVHGKNIFNFRTQSGEILRQSTSNETVYKALMKKVAKDKIENYKLTMGLSGRKKADREKIQKFIDNIRVSIFDFFYLMRLRMNYRNLDFISDIPATDTEVYFKHYYFSANNFYKATTKLINSLL